MTDQQLLEQMRRAVKGDGRAWAEMETNCKRWLLQAVKERLDGRIRARLDAGDVVQSAWAEVVERLPGYLERRPMLPKPWLGETAKKHVIDAYRKHFAAAIRTVRREVSLPSASASCSRLLQHVLGCGTTPSQVALAVEKEQKLYEALGQLTDDEQKAVWLRCVEDETYEVIAERLGIHAKAAARLCVEAVKRLREELLALGVSSAG